MHLRGNVPKACQLVLRGNKRANVTYGVPMFQLGVPTYQVARQFFKHSSYETLKEISMLYCYIKKFNILLDIIVYHMCMYCTLKLYYTSFPYFMSYQGKVRGIFLF